MPNIIKFAHRNFSFSVTLITFFVTAQPDAFNHEPHEIHEKWLWDLLTKKRDIQKGR